MAGQGLIGFQLIYKMAYNHFVLWLIAEDSDVYLIAESLALQKLWFPESMPEFYPGALLCHSSATSYEKQLNAGSTAASPLLLMAFSKIGCSHTGVQMICLDAVDIPFPASTLAIICFNFVIVASLQEATASFCSCKRHKKCIQVYLTKMRCPLICNSRQSLSA